MQYFDSPFCYLHVGSWFTRVMWRYWLSSDQRKMFVLPILGITSSLSWKEWRKRFDKECVSLLAGQNCEQQVSYYSLQDISSGFVLCGLSEPCHVGRVFDAQVGGALFHALFFCHFMVVPNTVQIVILEYKSIICAGFSCVIHIHNVVEEVEIVVCGVEIGTEREREREREKGEGIQEKWRDCG